MTRPIEPASPGARLLGRLGPDAPLAPAADLMRDVRPGDRVIEDFTPLPRNLEWRLSELHWLHAGVASFVTSDVPYLVNNDGRAATAAAAVLFAACTEAPATGEPIRVLEIGAGTALFARDLLDEFRDRCRRHERDFYDRLVFHVTDRSPATVRQWAACGLFGEHAAHVAAGVCDAAAANGLDALPTGGPLRAVFANYMLDSLPAAVLRQAPDGWEQLCAQATLRDDAAAPATVARLTTEQLRDAARADGGDAVAALLPLLPWLEGEMRFRPIADDGPPGWEAYVRQREPAGGAAIVYNYGALACLDRLVPRLDAAGFVLVRDYVAAPAEGPTPAVGAQRFGDASAMPLDLPAIEAHLRARGVETVTPNGRPRIHTRLFTRAAIPAARARALASFGDAATDPSELEARARAHGESGLWREAIDAYRAAIAAEPRNWQLLGEAAHFAATVVRDPQTGLELARAAVQLNPWYSPRLWIVLGDCLAALARHDDAHECFAEALRLHPQYGEGHLRLAASFLHRGDAARSFEAVAQGLAADRDAVYRHELLAIQQAAVDRLAQQAAARREVTYRRRLRQDWLAAGGGDEPGK